MSRSKSKRKRLTDKWLASYVPKAVQEDFWDDLVDGFGVRFSSGGAKTFQVRYRADGVRRRKRLGRYPLMSLADAREEAQRTLRAVEQDQDPAQEDREAQEATFGKLVDAALEYLGERTRPKTMDNYRWVIESELLPSTHDDRTGRPRRRAGWKNRPAGSITRGEVLALHKRINDRGTTRWANEVLKVVHRIFNIGLRLQFPGLEYNPAAMVEHFPETPKRANPDRYLNREEIGRLWHALEAENPLSAGIMRLALLTSQRWGAVAKMRWADVDLERREWTIPGEPGDKIKIRWSVPLSPPAMRVLEELRSESIHAMSGDEEYVFPSRDGAGKPHIASIKELMKRLRPAVGGPHWVAHDLRTTFRTYATRSMKPRRGAAGLGIDGELADLVGSRVEQSVGFRSYQGNKAEYRIDDRADALDAWGAFVLKCAKEFGAR